MGEVMWKIDQFDACSLAQVAMSCAKLGHCTEVMFDWVAARVIGRLHDYRLHDLANVLWAFGQARIKHHTLVHTIAAEVAKLSKDMTDRDFARICWACDRLEIAPRAIYQPLYHNHL